MAVITIDGLTKRFDVAVDDLSFEVDQGTVAVPGAQRHRQDHHPADAARTGHPDRRHREIDGRPYRMLADPVRHVGAVLEASSFHPGRSARNHLRVVATAAALAPAPTRSSSKSASPRRPTGGSVAFRWACANAWA